MTLPACALFFAILGFARAQTLYDVSVPVNSATPEDHEVAYDTISLSAAGVGTDGATTYIEQEIESELLFVGSTTTETLLSTPLTMTATLVENASGALWSGPVVICSGGGCQVDTSAGPAVQTCAFGTDGYGTCVDRFPYFSGGITFSGAVVPYYTLNAAAAAVPPSATASSHIGAIVGGVVGGVLLGLLGAGFLVWRRRQRRWRAIEHGSSNEIGEGPLMTTLSRPSVPTLLLVHDRSDAPALPADGSTPSIGAPSPGHLIPPPSPRLGSPSSIPPPIPASTRPSLRAAGPSPIPSSAQESSRWSLMDLKRAQTTGLHQYDDPHTAPDEVVETSRGLVLSAGRGPGPSPVDTKLSTTPSPSSPKSAIHSAPPTSSEPKNVLQELKTLREEMRRLESGNVLREQALRDEIRRLEVGAPPSYA
ncbi:hypothetical protein C8R46DRAFT_1197032 [Mycena filopes]|nr:hypothetical protein C8R46DRAFT_1197032 [Mycena filopes]